MASGKSFNLFLMDGEVTGRIKCATLNWTGIVYKIPRSYLDKCRYRKDLKHSGVYFLFDNDNNEVYIGQAGSRKNGEGVLYRVCEHLKDDREFNDAVIITTNTHTFGPTEISYLENKFTNLAKSTGRYKVRNANDPNPGHVTEEKESELEEFIDYSKMFLGVLGYKVFVPMLKKSEPEKIEQRSEDLHLYLSRKRAKTSRVIKAECIRTDEGFVVLKGSMIEESDVYYGLPDSIKNVRETLKSDGKIINGKLTVDYLFNSPSYAAMFVLGLSSNGRTEWKTIDGTTLKDIEEIEVKEI